jgi:hypothetical protein
VYDAAGAIVEGNPDLDLRTPAAIRRVLIGADDFERVFPEASGVAPVPFDQEHQPTEPAQHEPFASPAPAQRKRTAAKGEKVRESFQRLFPNGVPAPKDLPNPYLIQRVRKDLENEKYTVPFGDDVILREAGRKAKRSRSKTSST